MFVSIRRYRHARKDVEAIRLCEEGLVPILKAVPGFQGYYGIDCGGDTLTTISFFESPEAALASAKKAAIWVKENIGDDRPPEACCGEVLLCVTEPHAGLGMNAASASKSALEKTGRLAQLCHRLASLITGDRPLRHKLG